MLLELAKRDGELVTKEDLIDALWGGRPIGNTPINRGISQLRGHLGDRDKPHRYVETLQKRGYRLMRQVELLSPDESPPAAAEAPSNRLRLRIAAGSLLLLGIAAVGYWFGERAGVSQAAQFSIAVTPFVNSSGEASNQYLVEGFKEELIKSLQPIPSVVVKNARAPYPQKTAAEIAELLDVDSVLFGSLHRNGDVLKVSYELANGEDNRTLSTGNLTRDVGDIFSLQEDLAEMVRKDLFPDSTRHLISASRPSNFAAYKPCR